MVFSEYLCETALSVQFGEVSVNMCDVRYVTPMSLYLFSFIGTFFSLSLSETSVLLGALRHRRLDFRSTSCGEIE